MIYDDSVRSAAQSAPRADARAPARARHPGRRRGAWTPIRTWRRRTPCGCTGPTRSSSRRYPYQRSGWLRRDLVQRIRDFAGVPVEHVVVLLTEEPFKHTLVVANQTVTGRALIEALERRSTESPHRFTVICPQDGAENEATEAAQERLDETLRSCGRRARGGGLRHPPGPADLIVNTHQFDPADEIVISTLPSYGSNWLRGDLINRARRATGLPVEHVTSEPESVSVARYGRDGLRWNPRPSPTAPTPTVPRRPTAAPGSTRSYSGCCCSSSPRRCCSGRSSRPCSSSAWFRTPRSRRIRSTSRSPSRPSTPRSWSRRAGRCTTPCTRSSRATASG